MRRREFIKVIAASAAAWPIAARAQQAPIPVVGFINAASAQNYTRQLAAFLKGLGESGYVDGRNVAVEYRWAEGQNDRLPAMAADLVHRQVAVIAATSTPAALAAKAVATNIPIVFETGGDPIRLGLVSSLSRPDGNVTGVTQASVEVSPKRLELLHELLPTMRVMALLIDPTDSSTCGANGSSRRAGGFPAPRVRCGRRSAELWIGHYRIIPSHWHLHRPGSQGRQTCRTTSSAGH